MTLSVTTIEIFLPILGALVIWLVPMPRTWVGALATLVAMLEVYVWIIDARAGSTSATRALELGKQTSWFSDLHVSYHVGQYAFSIWLSG
jgi:NADH:ubiquinone oxidoreductase subunit 4 (subunit M)